MKIYIVCPVTNATELQKSKIKDYVDLLETYADVDIFYPARDNPYEDIDNIGSSIIRCNYEAVRDADEIHLFWDKNSKGSYFDLGIAYAMHLPLYIVNPEDIEPKEGVSWENFLCDWAFKTEGEIS